MIFICLKHHRLARIPKTVATNQSYRQIEEGTAFFAFYTVKNNKNIGYDLSTFKNLDYIFQVCHLQSIQVFAILVPFWLIQTLLMFRAFLIEYRK